MSLGSPSHEGSVTSPRSPASGYGDHQSLMSSPQSGPVHYEMPTAHNNHPEQMDFNESAQPQAAAQAPSHFDTPNAFDQFDSTNTIDVNELLSKVN